MPSKPTEPHEERKQPERKPPDTPRTDLTPEREPYYEGYFGTEEEEGVVREEESDDEAALRSAEEAAGGDREIS